MTLEKERSIRDATFIDDDGRFYSLIDGTKCVECNRVFDLLNDEEAGEWAYGHDCEA